jgi:hypothetical protein
MLSKDETVEGVRTSGEEAGETLRALTPDQLAAGVYERGWNGHQLVAHIASIEWSYPRLIDIARAAAESSDEGGAATGSARGGMDAYNARQVEQRAEHTIEQLIEEFERNRSATIEAVEAANEELFAQPIRSAGGEEGTLAEVFENVTINHVRQHLRDLTGEAED